MTSNKRARHSTYKTAYEASSIASGQRIPLLRYKRAWKKALLVISYNCSGGPVQPYYSIHARQIVHTDLNFNQLHVTLSIIAFQ